MLLLIQSVCSTVSVAFFFLSVCSIICGLGTASKKKKEKTFRQSSFAVEFSRCKQFANLSQQIAVVRS